MEVFLVPAGRRYQLYCEVEEAPASEQATVRGRWRRLVETFRTVVDTVEAARHEAAHRRAIKAPRSFTHRVRDRVVCWLAEKVAEMRLLWHLRRQEQVVAWFPHDITESEATDEVRRTLREDARRHGRWAVVHSGGALLSLALVPLPGPNVVGYYFVFRLVGHYLSRLGALNGLNGVSWEMRTSVPLTELRQALALDEEVRKEQVASIAARLNLQHLAAFVERIAVSS